MERVELGGSGKGGGFPGLQFGTSGLRGVVAAMTDKACYCHVSGFLGYLAELKEFGPGQRIALAGDLRSSTPRILAACAQAVRDAGGEPVFCGFIPTPALAFHAMAEGMPSLMVTGSHIPDDRNGIKFYRAGGEVLKEDEGGILRQRVEYDPDQFDEAGALRFPMRLPAPIDAEGSYVQRYVDFFGREALRGLRVGVYQHSAVGRDQLVAILSALGCDVVPLGRSERFVPVDTEAIRPEDVELARRWAGEFALDAIVSTDGDGDRPLVSDGSGNWLRGDVVGVLCARYLGADSVVTPVSSSTIVERVGCFPHVLRTRIGSPFVIAAMEEALGEGGTRVCGYEANGGFLLGSDVEVNGRRLRALPTRDAVLPILAVLVGARPGSVADLVAGLPRRYTHSDRIKDYPVEDSRALMQYLSVGETGHRLEQAQALFGTIGGTVVGVDLTDGFRMALGNDRIIHVRPSGNAPELRCYTEAERSAEAVRLCEATLAMLRHARPWED